MVEHFFVSNGSRSLVWLSLCLKIILVFRYLLLISGVFFFLTGIIINLVHSFLLIGMESRSNEAVVLKVWVNCYAHILG